MYLRDVFALKPFHDYSLCLVYILPQPAFYSQSAVCILNTVCILPLVRSLQSAVRSLRFTLSESATRCSQRVVRPPGGVHPYIGHIGMRVQRV